MRKRRPTLIDDPADTTRLLVPLTKGRFAIIDREDHRIVENTIWFVKTDPKVRAEYAVGHRWCHDGKSRARRLHLVLWEAWGFPPVEEIDHVNNNGLDCRRHNLRPATSSQNKYNTPLRSSNTSGFTGVSFNNKNGTWRAYISVKGKHKNLGSFHTPGEANARYQRELKIVAGEFAYLSKAFQSGWSGTA